MMISLPLVKKIGVCALLTLGIYVVSQVYYRNDQKSPLTIDELEQYNNNKPTKFKRHKSSLSPSQTHDELEQHINKSTKFKRYVSSLSPSQTQAKTSEMGFYNLTTEAAQRQFLKCAGSSILYNSSVHIPPTHQHCKKMSFKNSGPVVILGSFPGSGNSWIRQLLESATGIYTGAVFCDKSYIQAGMIGEGVTTANVIAVKAHAIPAKVKRQADFDKAIYLVRSPFACILSENNRCLAKKAVKESNGTLLIRDRHTLEIDYNYENNPDWETKVKKKSSKWTKVVSQWLSVKEFPVLFVGYENLMKDKYTELKRMLDFTEYPYSEDDLLCTIKSSGEGFHRNHSKKHLVNPYSPELQEFVLNQIKTVDAKLLEHGISLYHPYTI